MTRTVGAHGQARTAALHDDRRVRQLTALDALFLAAEKQTAPKAGYGDDHGTTGEASAHWRFVSLHARAHTLPTDRFEFVALIPGTATGRIKKTALRDQFTLA